MDLQIGVRLCCGRDLHLVSLAGQPTLVRKSPDSVKKLSENQCCPSRCKQTTLIPRLLCVIGQLTRLEAVHRQSICPLSLEGTASGSFVTHSLQLDLTSESPRNFYTRWLYI